MKMYCVYFGDTYIKGFTDDLAVFNLVNSLRIFCAEHDVDYSIKIVTEDY